MEITKKWLDKQGACADGVEWFIESKFEGIEGIALVKKTMKKKMDWANWLVVRLMTHDQQIKYAVFAAEQVINIYEEKYPDDKRPREAIEAAKKYLGDKTEQNKKAADAAYAAAHAAHAAHAANAAAYAAYAAANAADAANAANAAAYAAYAANAASAAANAAAKSDMFKTIINYGIEIIQEGR
jgi:hypothetical protein